MNNVAIKVFTHEETIAYLNGELDRALKEKREAQRKLEGYEDKLLLINQWFNLWNPKHTKFHDIYAGFEELKTILEDKPDE